MQVLGIRIDNVTPQQALEQLSVWLRAPYTRLHRVVTLNAEGVMLAKADPAFAAIVAEADLVTPDGHGIVWAASQYGEPLAERVTGIDLLHALCERGAAEGWRIYLLGSVDGVAAEAAEKLQQLYPGINIVGTHHGYFRGAEQALIETVNAAQPDLLFAALGMPFQEKWLHTYADALNAKVAVGVGGSLDVVAGRVKRAPKLWQNLHLEWLWRTLLEPKRLKRISVLPKFMLQVKRDAKRRK